MLGTSIHGFTVLQDPGTIVLSQYYCKALYSCRPVDVPSQTPGYYDIYMFEPLVHVILITLRFRNIITMVRPV